MDILNSIRNCGIVPVVVIEASSHAVPAARALYSGGIKAMEITLRSDQALESIRQVASQCPEIIVGAGTVCNVEQCKVAVDAGAKFIVSPGFDRDMAAYCLNKGIPLVPGCVTPSEIMQARNMGLKVLKFFPTGLYGGVSAMKTLTGPFADVSFIPTGGITEKTLPEYISQPFIWAVGGSWICSKADISDGNFDRITELSRKAIHLVHGFTMQHIGINAKDGSDAFGIMEKISETFGFDPKPGNSSNFAGDSFEIMKGAGLGEKGHIGIGVNDLSRAIAYFEDRGYEFNESSMKYKNGKLIAVYFKEETAGFAIHLIQK